MGLDGVVKSWTAVIPVKGLDEAKTRLGLPDDPRRPELALAFALDVIGACLQATSVSQVIVVTDDLEVMTNAAGVTVCPEPIGGGLNQAIRSGAALCKGPVVALAGDLPCLTPQALDYVLGLAEDHERSVLSDMQGSGTAMLCAADAVLLDPRFGIGSRSAHVQTGCVDLALDAPASIRTLVAGARRDVDTPADLWDALRLGVGTNTAAVLRRQS